MCSGIGERSPCRKVKMRKPNTNDGNTEVLEEEEVGTESENPTAGEDEGNQPD